eukprot:SAG31_NODE_1643_length_7660_cov_2.867875_6_plen_724_part_00
MNHFLPCVLPQGKTIQTLVFLENTKKAMRSHTAAQGEAVNPMFLIVVPLSTLANWQRETKEWSNLEFVTYYGNGPDREKIKTYEFQPADGRLKPRFDILLTTPQLVINDHSFFMKFDWDCIVVDEAHSLKNCKSKFFLSMQALKAMQLVLLTGTPIQNNAAELYALLNMVASDRFPDMEDFTKRFGLLETADQVSRLHEVLKQFLLRRCKDDVETHIPPKEETLVEVELTKTQKQYYRAILEKNISFLKQGSRKLAPQLMNIGMELRKLCNHPYLVKGAQERLTADTTRAAPVEALVKHSGKFVLLDKLLPKLRSGSHKVLIFSQMVQLLYLLEDYLTARGFPHECLHGSISANDRQAAIRRYCTDEKSFIFLLSTRAGGLGINLTVADTVIIFDSDWNPQNDLQAQARCHRIGQEQEVKIYRLISRNTYEMQLYERASQKLGLDRVLRHYEKEGASEAVSSGPGSKDSGKIAVDDVQQMLRYGTIGVLDGGEQQQEQRSNQFMESDIDQILERSSRVVRYEGVLGEAKNNVFAKASFVSDEGNKTLDLNDPNFWQNLIPDASSNAATLMGTLSQLDATVSHQVLAPLLDQLQKIVVPVVEARANGEQPDEMEAILSLLESAQLHPALGPPTKDQCAEWASAIERPKRKRNQVKTFNPTWHESDEETEERQFADPLEMFEEDTARPKSKKDQKIDRMISKVLDSMIKKLEKEEIKQNAFMARE